MFKNIDEKIKRFALIFFWLGLAIVVAMTIFACSREGEWSLIIGCIIAIGGFSVTYFVSFVTYGFGQVITMLEQMSSSLIATENKVSYAAKKIDAISSDVRKVKELEKRRDTQDEQ